MPAQPKEKAYMRENDIESRPPIGSPKYCEEFLAWSSEVLFGRGRARCPRCSRYYLTEGHTRNCPERPRRP